MNTNKKERKVLKISHDTVSKSVNVLFSDAQGNLEEFSIADVHEAYIGDLNFDKGELVEISVSSDHPLLWHYGSYKEVYGKAPLADPPRFFVGYYNIVNELFGEGRPINTYLRWPGTYNDWRVSVLNRAYNLAKAPSELVPKITELLDDQAVEYTVLELSEKDDDKSVLSVTPQLLKLGKSWVIYSGKVELHK